MNREALRKAAKDTLSAIKDVFIVLFAMASVGFIFFVVGVTAKSFGPVYGIIFIFLLLFAIIMTIYFITRYIEYDRTSYYDRNYKNCDEIDKTISYDNKNSKNFIR